MDTLLRMEAKISPALGAIEPAIFLLLGVCSTAVLQLLPSLSKPILALLKSSRAFIKFVSKYFLVILLFTVGPKTSPDFSSPGLMSPGL